MTVLTLTTGSAFIMWLGEQISERGIGNGMSLIIFVGIVVGPAARHRGLVRKGETQAWGAFTPMALILLLGLDGGRAWPSSSTWRGRSGAFPCSTPSASWAAA